MHYHFTLELPALIGLVRVLIYCFIADVDVFKWQRGRIRRHCFLPVLLVVLQSMFHRYLTALQIAPMYVCLVVCVKMCRFVWMMQSCKGIQCSYVGLLWSDSDSGTGQKWSLIVVRWRWWWRVVVQLMTKVVMWNRKDKTLNERNQQRSNGWWKQKSANEKKEGHHRRLRSERWTEQNSTGEQNRRLATLTFSELVCVSNEENSTAVVVRGALNRSCASAAVDCDVTRVQAMQQMHRSLGPLAALLCSRCGQKHWHTLLVLSRSIACLLACFLTVHRIDQLLSKCVDEERIGQDMMCYTRPPNSTVEAAADRSSGCGQTVSGAMLLLLLSWQCKLERGTSATAQLPLFLPTVVVVVVERQLFAAVAVAASAVDVKVGDVWDDYDDDDYDVDALVLSVVRKGEVKRTRLTSCCWLYKQMQGAWWSPALETVAADAIETIFSFFVIIGRWQRQVDRAVGACSECTSTHTHTSSHISLQHASFIPRGSRRVRTNAALLQPPQRRWFCCFSAVSAAASALICCRCCCLSVCTGGQRMPPECLRLPFCKRIRHAEFEQEKKRNLCALSERSREGMRMRKREKKRQKTRRPIGGNWT